MKPSYRSSLEEAASNPETANMPVEAILCYTSARSRATSQPVSGAAFGYSYSLIPARAVVGTPQAVLTLAADPDVEDVWEDLPVHTMLDVSVPLIRAPQLWDREIEGQGIRVAIIDTGIDAEHPDFEGRLIAVKDFTGEDSLGRDGHGHGTHVASTAAGSGASSGGKYIGVAPAAELLIAKVLRNNGGGSTSDVMAGIDWAVQQGADVINLSLGADIACDGTDALSTLCDAAVAQGVVVCVAAGNAGPGAGTVGSPGCAREVITIGATTDQDAVTSFSSRGPTADGRIKPDVCFPGHGIVAARAKGTAMGSPVDAFYTSASGTSMATPHASGTAALLLQGFPDLTPAQVKQRLMATAKDLGQQPNVQGSGRADAVAAYEYVEEEPGPTPEPEPEPEPGPPTPEPGGCLTLGRARTTGDDVVQGGVSREFWWILAVLLLLCVCVTCAAAGLIAIGLAYG